MEEMDRKTKDRTSFYSLLDFIKRRPLCIPDVERWSSNYVEIESFIFEFSFKLQEKFELLCDTLRVAVHCGRGGVYYCAYELDEKLQGSSKTWFEVGNRAHLDAYIEIFARERAEINAGYMRVTRKECFIELKLKGDINRTFRYRPISEIICCMDQHFEHHDDDYSDMEASYAGAYMHSRDLGVRPKTVAGAVSTMHDDPRKQRSADKISGLDDDLYHDAQEAFSVIPGKSEAQKSEIDKITKALDSLPRPDQTPETKGATKEASKKFLLGIKNFFSSGKKEKSKKKQSDADAKLKKQESKK